MNKQLYAVCVIFNPRKFKSRYTLYRDFAPYMVYSGVKLLTVEISYQNRPFEVTEAGNPWHLQLHTDTEMWHKERAINLGIAKLLTLVPDAEYIAWIDADVKFSNPHWVADTVKALEHYDVVQPYSEAHNLNPKYESMWKCPSVFKKFQDRGYDKYPPTPLKYTVGGHPGLAWAAKRSTLEKLGGLIDFCIAGSGDTHMANCLQGDYALFIRPGMSEGFRRSLQRWGEKCNEHVKGNIGYVDGICFHYFHGKSQSRGYEKRWDIMCYHKFNPVEDIFISLNGLYQWRGNKPHLNYDLRRSMSERNEDSIDE